MLTAAIGYDHLQSYVKSEELLVIMHDEPEGFRLVRRYGRRE